MNELQRVLTPSGNLIIVSNSGIDKRSFVFEKETLSLNIQFKSFIVESGHLVKEKDSLELINTQVLSNKLNNNSTSQVNLSVEYTNFNKSNRFMTQDSISFHNPGQFNSTIKNSSISNSSSSQINSIEIKCCIFYINKNSNWKEKFEENYTRCLELLKKEE